MAGLSSRELAAQWADDTPADRRTLATDRNNTEVVCFTWRAVCQTAGLTRPGMSPEEGTIENDGRSMLSGLIARHFSAADRPGDAAEAVVTLVEQLLRVGGSALLASRQGRQSDRERRHRIYVTDGGCRPAQPRPKAIQSGTRRRFARNSSENSHGTQPIQNGHG